MMEVNFAEREQYLQSDAPKLKDCRRMGATHFAYGWACTPWGNWTDACKDAYRAGYRDAAANAQKARAP